MGSYYYASAHYLVTGVVLVWLWRRGAADLPARPAGAGASPPSMALALYLLLPTAPPRLRRGLHRRAAALRRPRLVEQRRVGARGHGRLHQPARGVPVDARRVGPLGGLRRPAGGTPALGRASSPGRTPPSPPSSSSAPATTGSSTWWPAGPWSRSPWPSSTCPRGRLDALAQADAGEPSQRLAHHRRVGRRPHRRQARLQEGAVARGHQPRVEHGHDAAVRRWSGSAGRCPGPAAARRGSRRPA